MTSSLKINLVVFAATTQFKQIPASWHGNAFCDQYSDIKWESEFQVSLLFQFPRHFLLFWLIFLHRVNNVVVQFQLLLSPLLHGHTLVGFYHFFYLVWGLFPSPKHAEREIPHPYTSHKPQICLIVCKMEIAQKIYRKTFTFFEVYLGKYLKIK